MSSLKSTARSVTAPTPAADLAHSIDAATAALLDDQRADGHWVFELEADATIPSEYVLLTHFLGEPASALEAKIANYLRRAQGADDGWPLVHGGAFNLSASVKAYFALKMIGDAPEYPHMQRARRAILRHGGAGASNVFTHFLLALYGVVPWKAVPAMPVEIMLLPRWFPIHISKISYWGRTVLVPLLVLQATRPIARNPRGVRIDELFEDTGSRVHHRTRAEHQSPGWFAAFRSIDALLHWTEWVFPNALRKLAIRKAIDFVTERRNGEGGLGAIFPAMANAVMMFDALGYPRSHPDFVLARTAIDKLVIEKSDEAYCQPCVSPVWDTALTCHALLEVGNAASKRAVRRALGWLKDRQVLGVVGDWADQRPEVRPGGWPFQYENAHYPDLDDTAVAVMAMERASRDFSISAGDDYTASMERAREWVLGLQSRNGGWAAFDADNVSEYLNHTPFADHGALLDPPTADVTARCVSMLAQLGGGDATATAAAVKFLRRHQRNDGSWYGRWGMNYIYGTWSVLCALNMAGVGPHAVEVRRAAAWLRAVQNDDGGWGEGIQSYQLDYEDHAAAASTASQTAWALLGLMAAGEWSDNAVERGIQYLLKTQDADGSWQEPEFTATGFPRVFYLRYHGYCKLFPLWALARYRTLRDNSLRVPRFGM